MLCPGLAPRCEKDMEGLEWAQRRERSWAESGTCLRELRKGLRLEKRGLGGEQAVDLGYLELLLSLPLRKFPRPHIHEVEHSISRC